MGSVLAIDYGEKRLGLAVSDPSRTVAHPLAVIERANMQTDIKRISSIVSERDITEIIIGNPRTMSGREGAQSRETRKFSAKLQKVLKVPIGFYDERLSSKEARLRLSEAGLGSKRAKGKIDKVAAALFLQSYLDGRRGET